jgi:hypothetical protein
MKRVRSIMGKQVPYLKKTVECMDNCLQRIEDFDKNEYRHLPIENRETTIVQQAVRDALKEASQSEINDFVKLGNYINFVLIEYEAQKLVNAQ